MTNIVKNIKRKINLSISEDSSFYKLLVKINHLLFHYDERYRSVHYGDKDSDLTYYIIRSRGKDEGLLSQYFYVVENVKYALDNSYIPYVDFSNDNCQYHVDYLVNNTNNAFEYYFNQPFKLTDNEIKEKRNVILTGWDKDNNGFDNLKYESFIDYYRSLELKNICKKYCDIKPYIKEEVQKEKNKLFKSSDVLGVFIRGTDYTSLKPKGHHIQPSINELINKIDEFLNKYNISNIYLVTEDYKIYKELKDKYNDLIIVYLDDFIKDYDGTNFVSEYIDEDKYQKGLKYLIKVLLLNECDYLVSSIANGSMFALTMKENDYKDSYYFDLGVY